MSEIAVFLKVCEQAARAGGAVLLDWVGRFDIQEKGPADLVTQADLAAQEAVRSVLMDAYPHHLFVGEEDASSNTNDISAEFCWIVDPLDGTTNYAHQVPHYATSVALASHGKPIVGVVFDPVNDECFAAAKGHGARLNGQTIRSSQITELKQALVAASFSPKVEPDSSEIHHFVAALLAVQAVRRTGSAALNLCYVAAGRFDAVWATTTKAWDIAAGALLVEEAGGVVTDLHGHPLSLERPHPIATANRVLHEQFLALLDRATEQE